MKTANSYIQLASSTRSLVTVHHNGGWSCYASTRIAGRLYHSDDMAHGQEGNALDNLLAHVARDYPGATLVVG